MTFRRTITAVAACGLAAAMLGACGSSNDSPNASPSLVPGATPGGKLNIGITVDQPGLGWRDGDKYSGFDVDTATYVARSLGVPAEKITWTAINPTERISAIETGKVDMVVATLSITPDRKEKIDFAGPYFHAHQDLLVRRNDTDITGPETLNGRTLCTVPGTTSAANITARYRGNITLVERPQFSDCVAALANSEVDAVTTDDVILAGYAAEPQYKGKLKVVGKGFSDELYGIGIKKGDTALVSKVNAALKQFIADGSWKASLDANVRPSGYNIPSPPTPGS
ncbi:glutamate ABC transporter substrate-binding protein [Gordonia sp. TBRC 11910]|uniref:Glutamate ABC transporter substrate-binding protein n=1 Tax=Gordonia asplenii TaxID=2725283 RepID=A0A848LBS6_9ACTN|nr:glutamate ABC transporter substrate-binding protein [Gordonia asplenii]